MQRRPVVLGLSAIFLGFLNNKITFAKERSSPRIDHVVGSSILPSGDSIVMVVGENLEKVVVAKLSVQAGEAEIIMRDPTHLVIRVNPKTPTLVGNISMWLSSAKGWGRNIEIRLICDPSQFCFDSSSPEVGGRYRAMSRYSGGTRYSGSSRYSVPQRYSRYQHSYIPLSDEIGSEALTFYIGEHLL